MLIRRSAIALFSILFAAGALSARAQAVPAAYAQRFTIVAGGLGSVFQPDYRGGGVALTGPKRLYGAGAYVDVKLTRYVQFETECRWLRFNPYLDITQNNYLIGPRLPIERLRFRQATPYAKLLIGFGRMNFEYNAATGRFADLAYGGGVDVKLTKKISVRAIDFEFQKWPQWLSSSLSPYGASVGIGYKIF
jgi:Outer membrane protein beta-barrel domain